MKVTVLYTEMMERTFTVEDTLKKFLKSKLDEEVLCATVELEVTVLYTEMMERTFTVEDTLKKFLKSKLDEEILFATEELVVDGKVKLHSLKVRTFLKNYKYGRRK